MRTPTDIPDRLCRTWPLRAVVVGALGALAVCGCSAANGDHVGPRTSVHAAHAAAPAPRFFSPRGPWNRLLAGRTRLEPGSEQLIAALRAEVSREFAADSGPTINTRFYSVPVYEVPAGAPTVRVVLRGRGDPALARPFSAVPLPADAEPAAGSDAQLVLSQPSTGRLWEFWRLSRESGGWSAAWGGAMRDAPRDPGVYGPSAWPGASGTWGASGSSLSIAGGLITLEDLRAGAIDHAVAIALPAIRAGFYAAPARRTDGTAPSPLALPEGAQLRLDPQLNLSTLHLPAMTAMIARAAQRYGIFVRDRSSAVTFYAQDPTPTGEDPYSGPEGYFEGRSPSALLARFPWRDLEVLPYTLHRSPQPRIGTL